MKDNGRRTRRSVLEAASAIGFVSLTGCLGSDDSGGPSDSAQSGNDGAGEWRTYDGGPSNAGANTATTGPTDDPTSETLYSADELYGIGTVPVVDDGTIAVYGSDDYLHAVSASGEQEWTFKISSGSWGLDTNNPAIRDGTVYFPTGDGLVAIADGERQWATNPDNDPSAEPIVTDDAIYQATGGGTDALISYDFEGAERWRAETDEWDLTKPAVEGSTVVQFGEENGLFSSSTAVIAWDAADGTKLWETEDIGPGPCPVTADGTVYAVRSTDDGQVLVAISIEDGSVQWESDPVSGGVNATPAVAGDEVYLAADKELHAFDAADGSAVWSSPYVATESIRYSPRVDAESVYLTTSGEKVVAVDREAGEQRWSVALEETFSSGYTNVSIADGTVYVATDALVAIS